ncbi:hypothetical protein ACKI1O_48255, partial [Streptomyces scabiei]
VSFSGAKDSVAAGFNQRAELSLKNPEYQGDADFIREFSSQSILWDHFNKDFNLRLGIGSLNHSGRLEYGKQATLTQGYFDEEQQKQISYKARLNWR